MIRVLYIIGWGRSGSTLLDTALGSFPGVVSTGELRYLWERGLLERRLCGCGTELPACPFWEDVLRRVEAARVQRGDRPARPSAREVVDLQRAVARIRHAPGLPARRNRRLDDLRALTGDVVRAVASVSGAEVIVDSSKMPADAALYLGAGPDISLHLVHVVRDPRAAAYSWQRRKMMTDLAVPALIPQLSPARSSGFWLALNLLAERLGTRAASYRRVRYEDLVVSPGKTLQEILLDVGVYVDVEHAVAPGGLRISANHTVAGNPSRFERGFVPLRLDDAWQREQTRAQRWAATVPAFPLLHRYGYRLFSTDTKRDVRSSG